MYDDIIRHVQNFLSPPYCVHCLVILEERSPLCTECSSNITPILPYELAITDHISMPVIACGAYNGPLAQLIRAKQHQQIASAHQLGILLADHVAAHTITADVLVPIPLHWIRYAARGYNQAAIIATQVSETLQVPVEDILYKTKHSTPQKLSTAQGRIDNIAGTFALATKQALMPGLHVVLVDDVMTTGSTLRAAARALLPLKPASLQALVVARVI